jgi:hypothetical protein
MALNAESVPMRWPAEQARMGVLPGRALKWAGKERRIIGGWS